MSSNSLPNGIKQRINKNGKFLTIDGKKDINALTISNVSALAGQPVNPNMLTNWKPLMKTVANQKNVANQKKLIINMTNNHTSSQSKTTNNASTNNNLNTYFSSLDLLLLSKTNYNIENNKVNDFINNFIKTKSLFSNTIDKLTNKQKNISNKYKNAKNSLSTIPIKDSRIFKKNNNLFIKQEMMLMILNLILINLRIY